MLPLLLRGKTSIVQENFILRVKVVYSNPSWPGASFVGYDHYDFT
jgi:hypothetical protein